MLRILEGAPRGPHGRGGGATRQLPLTGLRIGDYGPHLIGKRGADDDN